MNTKQPIPHANTYLVIVFVCAIVLCLPFLPVLVKLIALACLGGSCVYALFRRGMEGDKRYTYLGVFVLLLVLAVLVIWLLFIIETSPEPDTAKYYLQTIGGYTIPTILLCIGWAMAIGACVWAVVVRLRGGIEASHRLAKSAAWKWLVFGGIGVGLVSLVAMLVMVFAEG